jgi:hypothetical protein
MFDGMQIDAIHGRVGDQLKQAVTGLLFMHPHEAEPAAQQYWQQKAHEEAVLAEWLELNPPSPERVNAHELMSLVYGSRPHSPVWVRGEVGRRPPDCLGRASHGHQPAVVDVADEVDIALWARTQRRKTR